jgi:hypothetical protein
VKHPTAPGFGVECSARRCPCTALCSGRGCSCRRQPECSRHQGPPAGWSREALSKTQYPRLALQKSIFAAPFRSSLLVPRQHRPTGGGGRSCEKVKLAIPARPINLTRPSLDPFDALSTAFNPNSFACTIFTTLAARCNYSFARGPATSAPARCISQELSAPHSSTLTTALCSTHLCPRKTLPLHPATLCIAGRPLLPDEQPRLALPRGRVRP